MATYLKRTSKLFDLSSRLGADMNLRDLMCPVCRGILIEPVTLPCTHNLCLRCLKGTFEHNSLSCPLCRLRVGSWLRTATKSETLVNHGLWELIQTKFPKEVEDKHNGDERNLGLVDADYATNRILSTAGEIHREYEAQLKMAEEEMRRQRQVEQMASEVLIKKIQAEEQQQLLAQLAQDQLLAKTLAKKQVTEKKKDVTKCYGECTGMSNYTVDASKFNVKIPHVNNTESPHTEAAHLESRRVIPESDSDSELRRANMALLSQIRTDKYYKVKTHAYKDCYPKLSSVYNAVTKTLKHQTVTKLIQPCASNSMGPGCSTSRAYVTETKEELRVPSDVVNSKKKSLGIEVCMTHGPLDSHRTNDDERIGSAESSGSHDSINQEIHHFKPIKTVPRTTLKISSDGKQIDPKLIRVIPTVKRVINAVLKPPSPSHVKRIIGCSWSAFRGKARQEAKEEQATHNVDMDTVTLIDQEPSTSLNHSQVNSNKLTKHQLNDARLDFVPETSFDDNKNYTKNANKIINGTKLNKKLSLNDESDVRKTRKSWRTHVVRNGLIAKSKRHRNALSGRKGTEITLDEKDKRENSSRNSSSPDKTSSQNEWDGDEEVVVQNIAERIKKRKVNAEKRKLETEFDTTPKKDTRKKRRLTETRHESPEMENRVSVPSSQESAKLDGKSVSRVKRLRIRENSQSSSTENPGNSEQSSNATGSSKTIATSRLKRSARNSNLTKISSKGGSNELDGARDRYISNKFNYDSPPESCDETEERVSEGGNAIGNRVNDKFDLSDEEILEEQQRIERLLLQEREDFELARRLQAKFDEMERIAGRTRRSRRAVENASADTVDLREISTAATVRRTNGAPRPVKRSIVIQAASTMSKKKRRRPLKRVKQGEIRAR